MKVVRARASLTVVVLVAACGGTTAGELFTPTGDAGAVGVDASPGNDAGGANDAGRADAGGKPDAKPSQDAAPPFDAATKTPLACTPKSGNTCDLQTEICCRGATGYNCQAPQALCTGLQIPCAQASDCDARGQPGTVCCGAFDHNNNIYEVTCMAPQDCVLDNMHVVVCSPSDPDACPNGGNCALSQQTLPGFNLCL